MPIALTLRTRVAVTPRTDGMVVVASLHCCLEYDNDPTAAQEDAVRTLLASPDVDLVLDAAAVIRYNDTTNNVTNNTTNIDQSQTNIGTQNNTDIVIDQSTGQPVTPLDPGQAYTNSATFDFNPAADRLRVVSDTGQNLRINVADGTTTPFVPPGEMPGRHEQSGSGPLRPPRHLSRIRAGEVRVIR